VYTHACNGDRKRGKEGGRGERGERDTSGLWIGILEQMLARYLIYIRIRTSIKAISN
jgi:hypothetical protein